MSIGELSIRRPIFITCLVILMVAVGGLSLRGLPVDQWPSVTFPFISVTTIYPGAGPGEMESLVSKPLEDEIATIPGIKKVQSFNLEGYSEVLAEFSLETDAKYAEQQLRDKVSNARKLLPKDIVEPVVLRFDPSDQPVITLGLKANLSEKELFDLANEVLRIRFEQVNQVSTVKVVGGSKREIQVQLDRAKLKAYDVSALQVSDALTKAGENIPLGKTDENSREVVFRTLGHFPSIEKIRSVVVKFYGNDIPVTVGSLGKVVDTTEDETTRAFLNGEKTLFLRVFRQTGANTVQVADNVKKRMAQLNEELAIRPGHPQLTLIRDGAVPIRDNLADVSESIYLGIALAVVVVFLFLGSARSTVITGLAIPNSLIGAFILIAAIGFSLNSMTLLAMSLAVGLLVDDAIVVRENIFRHLELGKTPRQAAIDGTKEVSLAVVATTLTILAVFGPIAFVKGITGQFLREFGLTVCFAMLISLFDALTVAPMLSAYFAGNRHAKPNAFERLVKPILTAFDRFQTYLENGYEKLLGFTLRRPAVVIGISVVIFVASVSTVMLIPKTFLPAGDNGELVVVLDLPPGSNLERTQQVASEIDGIVRANSEVELTMLTVGSPRTGANSAEIFVKLVPGKKRSLTTGAMKDKLRGQLAQFSYASPKVKDYDVLFGGLRPFAMNLIGMDSKALEEAAVKIAAVAAKHPSLKDVDTNFRPGKPEFQVKFDETRAAQMGISTALVGAELRNQIEGNTAAKFRQDGKEYDVRVRLQDDERKLDRNFASTLVPNMNYRLVRLDRIATGDFAEGPSRINRQDRMRYAQVSADLLPGAGIGNVMKDISDTVEKEKLLPPGVRFEFVGQGEQFNEMASSMILASVLATLFIFLVLASLYESFVTPLSIMLALPLAVCGAFVALWIGSETLNIYSIIASIMLLGIATKNSILLVDYSNTLLESGMGLTEAIVRAGKTRLRPILMTSMALIAGTLPLALGLNEASKQRTSMGVAIIGGVVSSTLLTLVVVPAAYFYIEKLKRYFRGPASEKIAVATSDEAVPLSEHSQKAYGSVGHP